MKANETAQETRPHAPRQESEYAGCWSLSPRSSARHPNRSGRENASHPTVGSARGHSTPSTLAQLKLPVRWQHRQGRGASRPPWAIAPLTITGRIDRQVLTTGRAGELNVHKLQVVANPYCKDHLAMTSPELWWSKWSPLLLTILMNWRCVISPIPMRCQASLLSGCAA